MIHIDRSTALVPGGLIESPELRLHLNDASEFFRSRSRSVRQRQYEFDWSVLKTRSVHGALGEVFSRRCAFCTVGPEFEGKLTAHHLRPPQDAVGTDGETSRRHYWWLAYEWENIYLACEECQTAQGAKFPVAQPRARVGTTGEALDNEAPLLIDPCREDPEPLLIYLDTGEVVSSERRGQVTIATFDLNRPALLLRRREARVQVDGELAAVAEGLNSPTYTSLGRRLSNLYRPTAPFAALRRQFTNQWAQVRNRQIEDALRAATGGRITLGGLASGLPRVTNRLKEETATIFFLSLQELTREVTALPKPRTGERITPAKAGRAAAPRFKVARSRPDEWSYLAAGELRQVEIRNFRAIRHLRLDLTKGGPGEGTWLMLLGENGTGKSSVLQAIALALAGDKAIKRLDVDPLDLLRVGSEEGRISLTLTGSKRKRELRFGRGYKGLESRGDSEGVLAAAYGATRLLPSKSSAKHRGSRVENLFDPFIPLVDPADWVPDLSQEHFDAVARALKRLLDLDEKAELKMGHEGIELVDGDFPLQLAKLSDGYRAMAGLALDMMQLLLLRWGSLEAAEGIVLIDELGSHLHPRWQMKVTGSLREAFPRVQFITTTHDPLCLRGLHDGEVTVLRRQRNQVYALHDELPPVEGLAVDQLLTSEHFGLNSTMDPEIEAQLERYYALLAQRRRGQAANRELAELTEQLEKYRLLGSTLRERLALEAADEFVAAQRTIASEGEYRKLKRQTQERIGEIWRERIQR